MIRLKELRTHSNLSQQKMADVLGISRPAVAMWETGGSEPDNKTLEKIADYFNVSIDYLIPVLGRVAAGIPITAVEEVLDYEEIVVYRMFHSVFYRFLSLHYKHI